MHRDAQSRLARAVEGPCVIAGLADQLVARHAEPHQPIARRIGGALRDRARALWAEMADAGDDAAQRDAMRAICGLGRLADRQKIFAPCADIAATAEIGRQEDLAVDHPVGGTFFQHGGG